MKKHLGFLGTTVVVVLVGILNIYTINNQIYTIYVLLVGIPVAVLLSVFLYNLFTGDPCDSKSM